MADFKKDLYRFYGEKGEDFVHRLLRKPEIKWLRAFRRAQNGGKLAALLLLRQQNRTGIQIPARTQIGEGLYIGHCGRIIVNPDAVIGRNCNLATGVVIGAENRGKRKGAPVIGDRVWIGANAVVVGHVTVGDDVLIAPLAYVNFDVPSHSVVLGNPAKIIARENATESYIEDIV